jgi:adenylate cyclase
VTRPTVADLLESELLGGRPVYTRAEVSAAAGVDVEVGRRLWRALGFADVGDDERAFTERDVEALGIVQALLSAGVIDDATQVAMTRAMGQALARLADWHVGAVTDAIANDGGAVDVDQAASAARDLVPVLERLITYIWRRHLAAAAERVLASGVTDASARPMAVGFADLVGFTSLTRSADETQLAEVIERFEDCASSIIAEAGGRVIKTVGDEVMFAADSAAQAAEIGVRLAEEVTKTEALPDVRVGVAFGPVLPRLGDVFGEPVNLASRLTSIARPGSVLIDRELAEAIDGDDRWQVRRVPPRPVRGYTLLHPLRLRRNVEQ